jgi:3-oxoacyl-(acyl-carrier-protein) synthase
MTAPHPEGLGAAKAMGSALQDAGIPRSEVGYVNAHGTATPANDRAEALALKTVFGSEQPWLSSTKGMTGHTLGAAGAVEAVFSLLSLRSDFIPATVGLVDPDPELTVRHVPVGGVNSGKLHAVLSSSFGFGGNNAALVFTKEPR